MNWCMDDDNVKGCPRNRIKFRATTQVTLELELFSLKLMIVEESVLLLMLAGY